MCVCVCDVIDAVGVSVCVQDIMGREAAPILTFHAFSGEAKLKQMNVSDWLIIPATEPSL